MTYASGGLIQATDYNAFVGGTDVGNGATINQIWGIGSGDCGYGQTGSLVSIVLYGNTVSATQWASLINKVNTIRTHQSGAGSGISAPTAGTTISYLSTLSSAVSTAYTNRATSAVASSSSISANKVLSLSAASGVAASATGTWTVTFPSVDQARYFFNCGGYYIVSYNTFVGTSGRALSIKTLAETNFASKRVNIHTMGARTGTGGIAVTDTNNAGYYELPTVATRYCRINGSSYPYNGDYVYLDANTNAGAGSYNANGNIHTVTFGAVSSTTGSSGPNDSISATLTMTLTVYYPELTNLTSSWGTITIA